MPRIIAIAVGLPMLLIFADLVGWMGGAIADQGSRWIDLNESERRTLILCGVSAGFATVFGTPIAAAIFALEFVRLRSWAIIPCLATAFLADLVGRKLFFAQHADYRLPLNRAQDVRDACVAALGQPQPDGQ